MPSFSLAEVAEQIGAVLEGDGSRQVTGVSTLEQASAEELSFILDVRSARQAQSSHAGALVVGESFRASGGGPALLRHANPNFAFGLAAALFAPSMPSYLPGVHPSAVVDPDAKVHKEAHIGPLCTVAAGAEVGAGAVLVTHVAIGQGATVGERSVLNSHVVIYYRCTIGSDCILHSGVVVGSDGFGFDPGPQGWMKIPQVGRSVIEDGVEIGANSTVDRARFGVTRVGRGAKVDNLVLISHNSQVGAGSLLCGQAGMAGSAVLEPGVVLGAQSGVGGHIRISTGVRLGGRGGAITSLSEPGDYLGMPARRASTARREWIVSSVVERLRTRLARLERRVAQSSTEENPE